MNRHDPGPVYDHGWADGWAAGVRDGAAARPDSDTWVPVAVAWRAVRAGDVVVTAGGEVAAVTRSGWLRHPARGTAPGDRVGAWGITLAHAGGPVSYDGDPDEAAVVLVPVDLGAALAVCRAELGAVLLATRLGSAGETTGDPAWHDR